MNNFVRRMRQRAKEEGSGIKYRGRYYHQYFEGYTEYCVDLPNGKKKIERIYTGEYHVQDLSKAGKVWIRLLYIGLYALSVAAFLSVVLRPVSFNTKWFTVLAEAAAIIFMFRHACALVNYCTAYNRMTAGEYRFSSVKIKKEALRCGTVLFVLAVMAVGHLVWLQKGEYIRYSFCFIFSGVCFLAEYFTEKKIRYLREKSENKIPPRGIEISTD